jgi:threonyl-tRNA synthetase
MTWTTVGHLLLTADGRRVVIDATTNIESLGELDRATRRLVRQRRDRAPDFRSGRQVTGLLERLGFGTEDDGTERGHFRWWSPGVEIRRTLAEWLRRFQEIELRADPIATATLRDWGTDQPLRDLAGGYSDRLYTVRLDDRAGVLRYGGDPGYLSMLASLRERPVLPWRVYEQVTAFRRCRRGELGGLQRTRSFEFFDFHSLVSAADGMNEYLTVLRRQVEFVRHGHGAAVEVRVAYDDEQAIHALADWASGTGCDILVARAHLSGKYYRLLHNLFDDRGLHTMHGQLDETNAGQWMGHHGSGLSIVHAASGSLERWLLVYLLDGGEMDPRTFPDWLAPTHLSLLPLTPKQLHGTIALAQHFADQGLRVRVDDRDLTVRRRIRDSFTVWIPRTIVVGDAELAGGPLRLRSGDGFMTDCEPTSLVERFRGTSDMASLWSGAQRPRIVTRELRLG